MAGQNIASCLLPRRTIGALLRTARESKGLMIREIAAVAGVDSSHLGKFERDQRVPPINLAETLGEAYGVDPNELKRRILSKLIWDHCGANVSLAAETAAQIQEDAATYGSDTGVQEVSQQTPLKLKLLPTYPDTSTHTPHP